MRLLTLSQFFYIPQVSLGNQYFDFSEGGPEINLEIPVGGRSPQELVNLLSREVNAGGGQDYTFTFDRVENKITISAPGNFELLPVTGVNNAQSIFPLLGFTTDRSGSNSYTADNVFATVWRPQFLLQDYVTPSQWKEKISPVINEAGDGSVESFTYGTKSFYQLNVKYICNYEQDSGSIIENNPQGEEEAESFLEFIIEKVNIEIMPDRDSPNDYDVVLFEKSTQDQNGTGYKLRELTGEGLAGFYETGNLVFRKVNL